MQINVWLCFFQNSEIYFIVFFKMPPRETNIRRWTSQISETDMEGGIQHICNFKHTWTIVQTCCGSAGSHLVWFTNPALHYRCHSKWELVICGRSGVCVPVGNKNMVYLSYKCALCSFLSCVNQAEYLTQIFILKPSSILLAWYDSFVDKFLRET